MRNDLIALVRRADAPNPSQNPLDSCNIERSPVSGLSTLRGRTVMIPNLHSGVMPELLSELE